MEETDLPLGTNVEVVVGSKLQDFSFFIHDFVCDVVCKTQNALQPIQKV